MAATAVAEPTPEVRPAPTAATASRRGLLFGLLVVVCLLGAGGAIAWAIVRQGNLTATPPAGGGVATHQAALPAEAGTVAARVLVRSTARDTTNGKLAEIDLSRSPAQRRDIDLACDRVYMAAGRGICLWAQRGVFTTYRASLFGEDLQPGQTFDLAGIPSRARVSPDGRYAVFTVFVTGHSYAGGGFSTKTSIVDAASGVVVIDDLEELTVLRDGARIQAPDFNFWGVTSPATATASTPRWPPPARPT
jgi:hypothetical protein